METGNRFYLNTPGYKVFTIFNYIILFLAAAVCIVPLLNVLAISLSSPARATAGEVWLWPKEFTWQAYQYVLQSGDFWRAMFVSIERTVLGTAISVVLTILCAYPLSKSKEEFKARQTYVWIFFFTMLFSGGLVPTFLVVYYTGLLDTIWALVIPGAVNTWNIILMLNFFRGLPKELEEAAFLDGAGHWEILWRIVVPLSKPAIATITLFTIVGHWNSWFDGMLYMQKSYHYPLQTYLQSLLTIDVSRFLTTEQQNIMSKLSPKTIRSAQVFITAIPVLCIYPFLQKYFTTGLVLGSVKG
ncbi:carbohydrate ABC transporter permease [Mahella australiensis]|uniref:Binding-protein-dependent transport systems inner membrane component n=1 Tax=Mahella australiensis (strain DSM 15567 / CIP 107919 / 50-1 BON) TaxID=697281 RepID=F4A0U1_MAHA5|nr:carbohydrate ABC transporter permease [Mahella australiensis]AEE96987.1 binding-protein-dependent transport systems inner membrane component [Mahella australiensis 50-1 BON]